jgi:mycoredoxin
VDHVRGAVGDGPGFAGARTGENADGPAQGLRRLALLRVKISEDVEGHRNILAGKGVAQIVTNRLTMYSTPWCGYCVRLKRALEREGIEFDEVDIEQDPVAAEFVMSTNGGNATVPTILLPDGTTLTNPPLPTLLSAVRAA